MKKLTNMKESRMHLSPLRSGLPISAIRLPVEAHDALTAVVVENSKNRMAESYLPEAESREPEALTQRNHRHPIQQKLRPGNNHLIPGLDAVLHFVVVAHRLPDPHRLLPGHENAAVLGLGHEGKILSRQPRYGKHLNPPVLMESKEDPAPHKLHPPQ